MWLVVTLQNSTPACSPAMDITNSAPPTSQFLEDSSVPTELAISSAEPIAAFDPVLPVLSRRQPQAEIGEPRDLAAPVASSRTYRSHATTGIRSSALPGYHMRSRCKTRS